MDPKTHDAGRIADSGSIPAPLRRAMRRLGQDLKAWRKLRGLTQKQLADRAGISRTTLHGLEQGTSGVGLETFLRVLRALGVLDQAMRALDPYESDVGRLRSEEHLPERVRPRNLGG